MILKKPYGFLIKKFKLIHIILTFIYIYIAIKVNNLLTYYNNYIAGTESKLNAIKYINNTYIYTIIASILICLIVYALLRYKKKPKLLYIILISLYLVVAIIINTTQTGLKTLYITTLNAKTLRLYRDFLRIIIPFQYISIIFTTIRGLGFDIKKFDFKKDINELNLNITDEEEVELTIGGVETTERKIRRGLREIKYYYKENKLFILIIVAIILFLSISSFTIDKQIVNKVYKENEIVSTDAFNLQVLNTYITNKSYQNKTISKNQTSFVIVKIKFIPKTITELNMDNLTLKINNKTYTPSQNYSAFIDLGYNYNKEEIKEPKTYIFIYNVEDSVINDKMQLIYIEEKKVNLKPIYLDKVKNKKELKLTETLDLSRTTLLSGNITINSYQINTKFEHTFNYEINNKTYSSKINIKSISNTILNLDLTAQLPYNINIYDFINNYAILKYKINNEEYKSNLLNNKTPGDYKKGLYLEVDKEIENASNIWFEFQIRNSKYIYTIK